MSKPAKIERHRRPAGRSAPVGWLVVPILVMPLLAVPGWRVLWNQCGQMLPVLRGADRSASYRQARAALAQEAAMLRIRQAARTLAGDQWTELRVDEGARQDPQGFWPACRLLMLLRSGGADDAAVLAELRALRTSPPARLDVLRQIRIMAEALRSGGMSARQAWAAAWLARLQQSELGERQWPWLRELADRLNGWADRARLAGRVADAEWARSALIRLFTDLVRDSPTPEMALLGSDVCRDALQGLIRDREDPAPASQPADGSTSSGPAVTASAPRPGPALASLQAAAGRAGQLRGRIEALTAAGPTVLPYDLLAIKPAPAEHDRAVRSAVAAAMGSGLWLFGLQLLLIWGLMSLLAQPPPGAVLHWAGRGARACVVLIAGIPWLSWAGWVYLARPAPEWMVSWPMLSVAAMLPAWQLVMIGLAVRSQVRVGPAVGSAWWSRWMTWLVWGLLVAAVVLVWVTPAGKPWQAPPAVRLVRMAVGLLGLFSLVVLLGWLIGAAWRWRSGRWTLGLWARAYLRVTAWLVLAIGAGTLVLLVANLRADARHNAAYAEQAGDPLRARLGADWYEQTLQPARQIADECLP